MGFFDSLFGSKESGGGFREIPLTEDQKRASEFLEGLMQRIMNFAPRQIAGLTPAEKAAVGMAEKTVTEGIPGVSEAQKVLIEQMTGDVETVPGLKGLFAKTKELGADLMGRTKRGLSLTGNLPSESSRGAKIYGRTGQDIMNELVTAAYPFYAQGLGAKLAAPGQLANLGMQDVATRTGIGTTVGALPRQIEQSIFDAILEAARTTKTFPYQYQAPVAQNIMGQTRYGWQDPTVSPSIFSSIGGENIGKLLKGGVNMLGGGGGLLQGIGSVGSGAIQGIGSLAGGIGGLASGAASGIGSLLALLSDERFKENIKPIENALEKVKSLDGKIYNFKINPNEQNAGLIAQELEKVLPEAVVEKDGIKYVKYEAVIALLVNAVKELAAKAA